MIIVLIPCHRTTKGDLSVLDISCSAASHSPSVPILQSCSTLSKDFMGKYQPKIMQNIQKYPIFRMALRISHVQWIIKDLSIVSYSIVWSSQVVSLTHHSKVRRDAATRHRLALVAKMLSSTQGVRAPASKVLEGYAHHGHLEGSEMPKICCVKQLLKSEV